MNTVFLDKDGKWKSFYDFESLYKYQMMENKYFKPKVEDIHVGYDCEALWCCPEEWIKIKITKENYDKYAELSIEDVISKILVNKIRTPYLTEEQIEKEGWLGDIKNYELFMYWGCYRLEKDHYILIFNPKTYEVRIHDKNSSFGTKENDIIFRGTVLSINEFRTICKLLNIK